MDTGSAPNRIGASPGKGREPMVGADSRPVTLVDVAAAAGVSVATVSKVLNGRSDVAPATRGRVERILAERGYRRPARGMPKPRTEYEEKEYQGKLIELLFHDAGTPWSAEMIRGVEETARLARVGVVVSVLGSGARAGKRWLEDLVARQPIGAILALSRLSAADHRRLAALGVPAILVDPDGELHAGLPSIGAGNWGGGMAATQHLIDLGHRRIGVITGPLRMLCCQARLAGYRAALENAGIPYDQRLVGHGEFTYPTALAATLAMLEQPEPPTAIFAANDVQALAVCAAAHQRGLRIPRDLSVVGFDDVPMSQWVTPPLTTVRQPIAEIGALAARSLLDHTGGTVDLPTGRVELATTMVVRESTAPPAP